MPDQGDHRLSQLAPATVPLPAGSLFYVVEDPDEEFPKPRKLDVDGLADALGIDVTSILAAIAQNSSDISDLGDAFDAHVANDTDAHGIDVFIAHVAATEDVHGIDDTALLVDSPDDSVDHHIALADSAYQALDPPDAKTIYDVYADP
jgi:hypothetical protein